MRTMPVGPGTEGPVATYPIDAVLPAGSECCQLGAVAIMLVLSWMTVAFQPLTRVTPVGTVQLTTHGITARGLVFVTDTVA